MLVLSRNPGERIVLLTGAGERIVIDYVLRTRGDKIRIGITAPESVAIVREEIEGTDSDRPRESA